MIASIETADGKEKCGSLSRDVITQADADLYLNTRSDSGKPVVLKLENGTTLTPTQPAPSPDAFVQQILAFLVSTADDRDTFFRQVQATAMAAMLQSGLWPSPDPNDPKQTVAAMGRSLCVFLATVKSGWVDAGGDTLAASIQDAGNGAGDPDFTWMDKKDSKLKIPTGSVRSFLVTSFQNGAMPQ